MEYFRCIYCVMFLVVAVMGQEQDQEAESSGYKVLKRVYDHCDRSASLVKCLKIQALKFTDRALVADEINLLDGLSLVRSEGETGGRSMPQMRPLAHLEEMRTNEIDGLLMDRAQRFLDNHQVQFSVPRLMSEGRGDKLKKFIGPLLAAITIKGGMLALMFKGVALLAGKALLVGKIALVLSAILGIKKLLSHDGHEKTTYEIVKHPHVSHSQTYSSSHYGGGGDYEASGSGGHYHRSLNGDEMLMQERQERAYKAHVPKKY